MMLFIISEIMVFGAFFTAYFFIRIAQGEPWPDPGTKLPVAVAGVNTAILVSSSFTIHWAEQQIKKGNHWGLKAGMLTTLLLGITFLTIQINEYANIGFAPQDHAQATIFYSLTGLHGAHVFIGLCLLLSVTIRAFRGHYSAEQPQRCRGAGHLLALRGHHVAGRVHDRLHPVGRQRPVLNPLRSEAEAFRLLLYVIVVVVIVIALILIIRAIV